MHHDVRQQWGEALRRIRQDRGLTLRELGAKAEVDWRHLGKVEQGLAGLSDAGRMRVAAALDVRVEDIWAYPEGVRS